MLHVVNTVEGSSDWPAICIYQTYFWHGPLQNALLFAPNRAMKKISKIGPEPVKCQSFSKKTNFLLP